MSWEERRFWDEPKPPNALWLLIKYLFWIAACIGVVLLIRATVRDSRQAEAQCQILHHGQSYVQEEPWGETGNGCQVMYVTKFNGDCERIDHLYVTNCSGVSWDQRSGKTTIRRSTGSESQ
jgi:hypothetical protein